MPGIAPAGISTRNNVLGSASATTPSISITPSLAISDISECYSTLIKKEFYQLSPSLVNTIGPDLVIATVSSNSDESEPSAVASVQPSSPFSLTSKLPVV